MVMFNRFKLISFKRASLTPPLQWLAVVISLGLLLGGQPSRAESISSANSSITANDDHQIGSVNGSMPGSMPGSMTGSMPDSIKSGGERLRQFQQQVQRLQGNFSQQVVEGGGLVDEELRGGEFWIERPNKIRWHYRDPYEQLIVADGVNVWMFDPELEQVIVRELVEGGDDVAGLLLGGGEDLNKRFTVTTLGRDQYQLIPINPESPVAQVVLFFSGELMVGLDMTDKLGVVSKFKFLDLQVNPPIDPAQFTFTPPPGIDLVIQ